MQCDLQISNPEILDTLDLATERYYPTPYVNSPLLPLLILSLMRQRIGPKTTETIKSAYDYIVVGAGAGGSSVAGRLSEISDVSVLVLEAGHVAPVLSDVPSLSRYYVGSDMDWNYQIVPQKNAATAHVNKQLKWPSGKCLGGSSIIGYSMNQRGNRKVYDTWAAQGAKGWSYKDVFPYFMKLEDNWDPDFVANGYHSTGGPTTAQRPKYKSEIQTPILETARQMGFGFIDTNAANQTGFSDFQGIMGGGQKCNTAEDYLAPAENRTNLDIVAWARVTKVVIKDKQAVAVQFESDGSTIEIEARREVILSAGVINTPQILMNSGIGPEKHLKKCNISVVSHLPVGKNFHDHSVSMYPYLLDPSILTPEKKLTNFRYLEEYISNRTGPLSSLNFISAVAFLPRESDPPEVDFPSQQLHFMEVTTDFFKQMNLLPEVYEKFFAPNENQTMYACIVSAIQPKSRGLIRLNSTDPFGPPLINPNYFADPSDIKDIVQGLKTCDKIAKSDPMKTVGAKPFTTPFPGCEKLSGDDDKYFECVAKSFNFAFPHGVGSVKMGDPADPTAVVDPELRVKGVKGLRVVDASIMPIIPNANTYIATVMIGEKAADMIKKSM